MATIKAILWPRANKAGHFPIKIRIIENRKSRYVATGYSVARKDWNENKAQVRASHFDHAIINEKLKVLLLRARSAETKLIQAEETITASRLKQRTRSGASSDFFAYADAHVEQLVAEGKGRTAKRKRSVVNKLKDYVQASELPFSEITVEFLEAYKVWLMNLVRKDGSSANSPNTIHGDFRTIQTFFNQAVRERLVPFEKNPFHIFKMKRVRTFSEKLSVEELRAIFGLEYPTTNPRFHALNAFKFAFFAGGIRIGDVLQMRWKHIVNGRALFQTEKTDDPKSNLLLPAALEVLELYRQGGDDAEGFIFPYLSVDEDYSDRNFLTKRIEAKTALINKYLKDIAKQAGISKRLTTHVARHSMADYLRRSGQSIYDISKILGHSSIKVTETYLKRLDYESVDEALGALNEI